MEKLELDSLASVDAFVKRYLEKKRPLHILINNAGMMASSLAYTVDGFEQGFGKQTYRGHLLCFETLIFPYLLDIFWKINLLGKLTKSKTKHCALQSFIEIDFSIKLMIVLIKILIINILYIKRMAVNNRINKNERK